MKRFSLLSFALVLPIAATACGSDDDGEGTGEEPTGAHNRYVVSSLNTSTNNRLDIDGKSGTENKLGELVALLTGPGMFPIQATVDEAIARGQALLLVDLQTDSFSAQAGVGAAFYFGDTANITPKPCTDDTMLATCKQHLAGTGSFSIDASAPRNPALVGSITGGTFTNKKAGQLSIQIAVTGAPIAVNLIGAKAQISEITADGIGKGIVGGAISQTEMDTNVLPAVHAQLSAVILRDCGPVADRNPANFCSCAANSTGLSLLTPGLLSFDFAPKDCSVSLEEIKTQKSLQALLTSDIMVDGQPGLSVGLGFTAKKATFTP